jgi:hypothetical protein
MMVANPDLEQLAAHMRYRLSPILNYAQPWRIDALTELLVRNWPHAHLEDVLPHGRNHAAVRATMRLLRARVREQWEARHGVGPLWGAVLGDAAEVISAALLELWFSGDEWRRRMVAMGRPADDSRRLVDR